jgi:hypothetical protein
LWDFIKLRLYVHVATVRDDFNNVHTRLLQMGLNTAYQRMSTSDKEGWRGSLASLAAIALGDYARCRGLCGNEDGDAKSFSQDVVDQVPGVPAWTDVEAAMLEFERQESERFGQANKELQRGVGR